MCPDWDALAPLEQRISRIHEHGRPWAGDNQADQTYAPLYDSTGNLVVMTGTGGKPIERYEYTPYGERKIFVDNTPPAIEQVRVKAGEIWIEMSEEVSRERLQAAMVAGGVKLVNLSKENREIQISFTQPVKVGRQANRRLVIAINDSVPPEAGNSLELRIADQVLVDFFGHSTSARTFPISWAPGDQVLFDSIPPVVEQVCLSGQTLKILFSEEVDTTQATTVIRVDNAAADWTLSQDRYGLSTGLSQGSHTLHIGTAELDLQGLGLVEPFDRSFTVAGGNTVKAIFEAPDPRVSSVPTADNPFGFHGLPRDPETGLITLGIATTTPSWGASSPLIRSVTRMARTSISSLSTILSSSQIPLDLRAFAN